MISTPLEELLLQYFEINPTETYFTPTMEILAKLETMGLRGDQFRNKMELTAVLTKMGMKPVQKRVGQQRRARRDRGPSRATPDRRSARRHR